MFRFPDADAELLGRRSRRLVRNLVDDGRRTLRVRNRQRVLPGVQLHDGARMPPLVRLGPEERDLAELALLVLIAVTMSSQKNCTSTSYAADSAARAEADSTEKRMLRSICCRG